MLHAGAAYTRRFPGGSMTLANLSEHDPMVQMRHPEFDPLSAPGVFVLQFVDTLISSGRPSILLADWAALHAEVSDSQAEQAIPVDGVPPPHAQ